MASWQRGARRVLSGRAVKSEHRTEDALKRRQSLDEVSRELMTENPEGTYSIRIPTMGERVITVSEHGNARIIAKAEALRLKLSAR